MSALSLLLSDDLLDASRVTTTARASNLQVKQVRSFQQLLIDLRSSPVPCLLLDLHHPELRLDELFFALETLTDRPRLIGFGSHVDAARLKAARQAGLDQVMPRSQFFEEVLTALPKWLGGENSTRESGS